MADFQWQMYLPVYERVTRRLAGIKPEISKTKGPFIVFALLWILVIVSCEQNQNGMTLPQMHINHTERLDFGIKKTCVIAYIDEQNNRLFKLQAKARYRGGVSSRFDKHSFTIKLDTNISWAGLPPGDNWIINASYIDKTFIRHRIAYDLFREFSEKNIAAKCAYINVFIESKYNGLYILMERLNAERLKIEPRDTASFIFKDPPVFRNPADSFKSESPLPGDYFCQKYPALEEKNHNPELTKLQRLIFLSPDTVFLNPVSGIAAYIDLESFIDWHILLMVTNNGDGMKKNFYLYKQNSKSKIKVAPWDYDHSFGRDGNNELNLYEMLETKKMFLFKRLLSLNAFHYKDRLKKRYEELKRKGIISKKHILALMESYRKTLMDDIENNFNIWPVDSRDYFDDANFDEEFNYMKNWSIIHLNKVDSTINSF